MDLSPYLLTDEQVALLTDERAVTIYGLHGYNPTWLPDADRHHSVPGRRKAYRHIGFQHNKYGGGYLGSGTYFNLLDASGLDACRSIYSARTGLLLAKITLEAPLTLIGEEGDDEHTFSQAWNRRGLVMPTDKQNDSWLAHYAADYYGLDAVAWLDHKDYAGEEHGSQICVYNPDRIEIVVDQILTEWVDNA